MVFDEQARILASAQQEDGSWNKDPAINALVVLAFLRAGHVPGEGRYGETVEKGIRWVLNKQQDNGLYRSEVA